MIIWFQACEAWKREAEESIRKAKSAEEEKARVEKQRDEVNQDIKPNILLSRFKILFKGKDILTP